MSAYGFNEDKSKAFLPVLKSDIQLSNNAQETIASFFQRVWNATKDIYDRIAYVDITGDSNHRLLNGRFQLNFVGTNNYALSSVRLLAYSHQGVFHPLPCIEDVQIFENQNLSKVSKFTGLYDSDGSPEGYLYDYSYTLFWENQINIKVYYWDNV